MTARLGSPWGSGSRRARFLWIRARRVVAAVLLAVAGWVGVTASRPATTDTGVAVLVASRDLPAGARLDDAAVRELRLPTEAVPARALADPPSVLGRVLAGPLGAGEVLTETRVQGPGLLVGTPIGSVAVSVPVADPTVLTAVQAGDRVRMLALGTGVVVAEGTVLVSDAPTSEMGMFAGAGAGTGSGGGGRLLVAVDPAAAITMAAASGPAGVSGGFVVAVLGSG